MGGSGRPLNAIVSRHPMSRYLAIAALAASTSFASYILPYFGVWSHWDDRGSLVLRLNSDGTCEISSFDRATAQQQSDHCTYWVHGSRVRIRAKHSRDGEGFSNLDIELLRESNELLVHGDRPRTMRHISGQYRQE